MTFSMFVIFLGLIALAVAFVHYTQGFFSAAISAILCIFSAVLAISYHETIVESLLGGAMADSAHAAVLMLLFAGIYIGLRTLFDKFIPNNVTLPAGIDKAGAAVMGLVAGVFAAGLCAFAAQNMSLPPAVLGYARFKVEDRDVAIPQVGKQKMTRNAYDFLESDAPLHNQPADTHQTMLLPADDILISTVKRLSEVGSLSGSKPLSQVHPDWLTELFGQRLGVQNSGKRVAINLSAQTDVIAIPDGADGPHKDAGVYVFNKVVKRRNADFSSIHKGADTVFPATNPTGGVKQNFETTINIVIRTYFGPKAKDSRDNLVRFSPSSIRLVTQKRGDSGELEWTNYYPIGTLEDGVEFYAQRPDDFLFIDDATETEGVKDKAVDLIFSIPREGFLNPAKGVDPTASKITTGTFLEVKRLGRVDLSDQPILPTNKLKPNKAVAVMRKPLIKEPPKEVVSAVEAIKPPSQRILGVWEQSDGAGTTTLTVSATSLSLVSPAANLTIAGAWKETSGPDTTFVIHHDGKGSDGKAYPEDYTIQFDSDDSVRFSNQAGDTRTFNRKAGSGTPAAVTPGTPKPGTPGTPKPAVGDNSFVVQDVQENRKFPEPISVAAGSTGDVQVADGTGTVGVEETVLKSIKLVPTDPAKLKGAGEPLNRLAVPTGSVMIQVTAGPGPTAGGWAWKDKLDQIGVIDTENKRYPVVGVWMMVNKGTQIVAQFNADSGPPSLADFKPTDAPSQIWFAFYIPDGAHIKQIKIGEAVVKAFDPPVP